MIHYNDVRRYLRAHPEWADDCIPLCGCDGDQADDEYTFDAEVVTCETCLDTLAEDVLLAMTTTVRQAA